MKKTENGMTRKQSKQELKEYIEHIRDSEGNAVVDVALGENTELYDPLSLKGQKDLSGDIYVIPAIGPLRIRFHGNIAEEEQEEIKKMMHRHYVMRSFDVSWDLVANFRKMLVLCIFGVIMISVYLYFAITGSHVFVTELLSIVGSFSLWEAADALLLERPRLRQEHRNIEQSLNEHIEFVCD